MPVQNGMCQGCKCEVETTEHLFFECTFFSAVWYEVLRWWGFQAPIHHDCKVFFSQYHGIFSGSKNQLEVWSLVWFATIWVIWNQRNGLLFKEKKVEVREMLEQIKLKSWLWTTARCAQFSYPFSIWYSNTAGCVGVNC